MRTHNGMRPQDIAVLLKLVSLNTSPWQYRTLSDSLFIPVSEVSMSLKRSDKAGLINLTTRNVNRQSLTDFLIYGLRYVFPTSPSTMVTGIATAHSHSFFQPFFTAEIAYVWPCENGNIRGLRIDPLYPKAPRAALQDESLYKLLATIDILRVGKVRELNLATEELRKMILCTTPKI